ncbi:MAG: phosphatase PAP2 family protein, partial [Microthrixaceae bacterium]
YLGRPQRLLVWAMAGIVGLSRIQVSAHLPLDVVGGAGLGVAMGNAWNLAAGVRGADSGQGAAKD